MFMVPYTLHRSRPVWDSVFDGVDHWFAPSTLARQALPPHSASWDVAESDTAYTVTMDLPGFDKSDVKVSIDGKRVSIEAKTPSKAAQAEGASTHTWRERSFSQTFTLPVEIDATTSSASLERGVLTLTLNKKVRPEAAVLTIN